MNKKEKLQLEIHKTEQMLEAMIRTGFYISHRQTSILQTIVWELEIIKIQAQYI